MSERRRGPQESHQTPPELAHTSNPSTRRLRWEDHPEFKASLCYRARTKKKGRLLEWVHFHPDKRENKRVHGQQWASFVDAQAGGDNPGWAEVMPATPHTLGIRKADPITCQRSGCRQGGEAAAAVVHGWGHTQGLFTYSII